MKHTAVISGVGMVPFAKPGASAPYYQMGAEAARQALADDENGQVALGDDARLK